MASGCRCRGIGVRSRRRRTDTLSSVLAATAPSGTSDLGTYTYDPYGNTLSTGGTSPTTNPYRYTSGLYDASGLTKLGDRYYNSGSNRWTRRDPLTAEITAPDAVNRFPYSTDDPVNMTDPSGDSAGSLTRACGAGVATSLTYGAAFGAEFDPLAFAGAVAQGCVMGASVEYIDENNPGLRDQIAHGLDRAASYVDTAKDIVTRLWDW